MVILNTYPIKFKLKDGLGYPVYHFRVPPKTNFRFETISPGITFAGVLDAAGALVLETSLSAARPPSVVVWNGPSIDMDVMIPLIPNVDAGGDSKKFYLDKGAGVWDDRYGVASGQYSYLGPTPFDYDYYIQCDFPHFVLNINFMVTAAGTWSGGAPPLNSSTSIFPNAGSGATVMGVPNAPVVALVAALGSSNEWSGQGLLNLQDFEYVDARLRLPPGFTKFSVHTTNFNVAYQTAAFAGKILALVAEIHDDNHGAISARCC